MQLHFLFSSSSHSSSPFRLFSLLEAILTATQIIMKKSKQEGEKVNKREFAIRLEV